MKQKVIEKKALSALSVQEAGCPKTADLIFLESGLFLLNSPHGYYGVTMLNQNSNLSIELSNSLILSAFPVTLTSPFS